MNWSGPGPEDHGQSAPGSADSPRGFAAALRPVLTGILAPVGLYYGIREAGGSMWLALAAGAVVPAVSSLIAILRQRRADSMSLLMLATLAAAAALSLVTGSPRCCLPATAW